MRIFSTLILITLAMMQSHAFAEGASIARGKNLASVNCASCHAIGSTGESPLPIAPQFRDIATYYDEADLIDSFMEGVAVDHRKMPDWKMTEDQAQSITLYIMSLKPVGSTMGETPSMRGQALLQKNCAACHAVVAQQTSPNPKAPPFTDVVQRYDPSALEEALAEGIVTGHNEMPEFTFNAEQISDIIAYLDVLRARAAQTKSH